MKTEGVSYSPFKITYIQLLMYGVHVGHSFENSLLYTAWLVYTYCQNLLIMNLYKSIYILRAGLICIRTSCYIKGPVWFINLDKAAELYTKFAATNCGEIGWSSKWVNGLISNYLTLYQVFNKLYKISSTAHKKRQFWATGTNTENWFLTRLTWPRTIFVSSVANSYNPVREALYLGIPCLGVVDTDTYCNIVSIAFPGNDESIECLVFYTI